MRIAILWASAVAILWAAPVGADPAGDFADKAHQAFRRNRLEEAKLYADKAIALTDKRADLFDLRGQIYVRLHEGAKAIADFDKALTLNPKLSDAYDLRGSEHFKLGHLRESLADFDKFLELQPDKRANHWRRGIVLYELGRYEDGAKQFAAYENVDTNDVENAVWHYLCHAKVVGAQKARKEMLKVGLDRRVPLMTVYDLFAGKAKPEDVLAAARTGPGGREKQFYAFLYLGLYYESAGDAEKANEYLAKAAGDFAIPEYMGDAAKVHFNRVNKTKP